MEKKFVTLKLGFLHFILIARTDREAFDFFKGLSKDLLCEIDVLCLLQPKGKAPRDLSFPLRWKSALFLMVV